jgi:hypothetical protein
MSLDWPGWGRSGRDAETAIGTLLAYRDRYATVASATDLAVPGTGSLTVDIADRVPGNATTDFGAPGVVVPADADGWDATTASRAIALLAAAWDCFDAIVANAPAQLRKGPRGGGRDRERIVEHVLGAELAYYRKAGLRRPPPRDRPGLDALRSELVDLLSAGDGTAPGPGRWPAPYAVRRIAWHALDHAWEIEDRTEP